MLKKLPLEFQNAEIVMKTNQETNVNKLPSSFYQTHSVMNENFYKPISKCFKFKL